MSRHGKWISKDVRYAIYKRDNYCCAYCGLDLSNASPYKRTLDHIVAEANGGALTDPANLVTACTWCNSSKQDTPLAQWWINTCIDRDILPLYQIKREINQRVRRAI